MYGNTQRGYGAQRSMVGGRLLVAVIMIVIALISYFGHSEFNPVTGENQHITISKDQEVAIGLQSAPEMAAQHGGELADQRAQQYLDAVCQKLLTNTDAGQTDWPFDCHLLADPKTINAFALPGGQVFITAALFNLLETEGQLAGVMGHEIGHVVARHSAQRIAKEELTQGITGAVVMASYDPNNPSSQRTAQIAQMIAGLVNMKYGREDELQSDKLGVHFMAQAGYDPNAMKGVMEILAKSMGDNRSPEFFSTHPNPENRIEKIDAAIQQEFPNGLPTGLTP
jgi:beta-barrel assembly-enhancing protease